MWLFTVDGMFSVALASNDNNDGWSDSDVNSVIVRSRRRGHLERLRSRYNIKEEITKKSGVSCPYRLTMLKQDFAYIASSIVADVDYDAFKEAAKESRGKPGRRSGYIKLLDKVSESATSYLRKSSS